MSKIEGNMNNPLGRVSLEKQSKDTILVKFTEGENLLVECLVERKKGSGVTSYKPIPPNDFFLFDLRLDNLIQAVVDSYFSGLYGEDCFTWINFKEEL